MSDGENLVYPAFKIFRFRRCGKDRMILSLGSEFNLTQNAARVVRCILHHIPELARMTLENALGELAGEEIPEGLRIEVLSRYEPSPLFEF